MQTRNKWKSCETEILKKRKKEKGKENKKKPERR